MSKLNQILPEPMSLIFKAKGGTDMIFKNPQKKLLSEVPYFTAVLSFVFHSFACNN